MRDEPSLDVVDEARRYAARLARLPLICRMAVFNLIQAFEEAIRLKEAK